MATTFDPITYSAVQQLKKETVVPKYEYIWSSRAITTSRDAELTIRAMGAGGGGSGNNAAGGKGGSGGTVALKTINVAAGDTLSVVIPAGGKGGSNTSFGDSGGTLQVQLNGSDILSIPGGAAGGGVLTVDPTGADWFVKSTPPTGGGGGSAMLLEGFDSTGTATGLGGAGVLGNGGSVNGGGLLYNNGGGGFALFDMTVLRFTENLPVLDQGVAFSGGKVGATASAGGGGGFGSGGGCGGNSSNSTAGSGGGGGFGGGGGGGGLSTSSNGGGGGTGGFGGGGGKGGTGGNSNGGYGGQGFVTLEWRYI